VEPPTHGAVLDHIPLAMVDRQANGRLVESRRVIEGE
jgi:hypothetical protein